MKKFFYLLFVFSTLFFVSCDFRYSYGGYLFFYSDEELIFAGFDVDESYTLPIKTLEVPSKFYGKDVTAIGNLRYESSTDWCSLQGLTKDEGYYYTSGVVYDNYISTLVIPSGIKRIYPDAFYHCSELESLYIYATNPPDGTGSLPINSKLKIYVPNESVDLYKEHASWKQYKDYIFVLE